MSSIVTLISYGWQTFPRSGIFKTIVYPIRARKIWYSRPLILSASGFTETPYHSMPITISVLVFLFFFFLVLHYAGEPPWSISNTSKMLTDTQLLWFCFDATIRGCTTWQSLRRYYSAMQIIISRLTFKIIMSTTITRHLFYWLLKSLGRWKFKETIPKKRFRKFMQQLTDNSYWAKGLIRD